MTLEPTRRGLLALLAATAVMPDAFARPPAIDPIDADRELMVEVPGGRVFVRVNGRLDGPRAPIMMAHGGPGSTHAAFLAAIPLAAALDGGRGIVLWDQLDSGLSDRPGDPANWRVDRFAAEIAPIRRALGLDRVHLLGHSWGATLALAYAATRPKGLASLILQGPLISTPAWVRDAATLRAMLPLDVQATLDACEDMTPPVLDACAAATEAFYDRFWRLRPPPPALAAYEKRRGLALNARVYRAMWGPNEFRATGTLATYDGTPQLAEVTAPTLFLIGAHDEVTEATARGFAARTPGSELAVIPDAAHRVQTDNAPAWLATLRDWCGRHDRPGRA